MATMNHCKVPTNGGSMHTLCNMLNNFMLHICNLYIYLYIDPMTVLVGFLPIFFKSGCFFAPERWKNLVVTIGHITLTCPQEWVFR